MKRPFGIIVVIIGNLIPLIGTVYLGWNAWRLIFLHLAEGFDIDIWYSEGWCV